MFCLSGIWNTSIFHKNDQPLFFHIGFSVPVSFFSLRDSGDINVRTFGVVLPEALFIFFAVRLCNFSCSLLGHCVFLLSPSIELFIFQVLYFSVLNFTVCSFLNFCLTVEDSHFLPRICLFPFTSSVFTPSPRWRMVTAPSVNPASPQRLGHLRVDVF